MFRAQGAKVFWNTLLEELRDLGEAARREEEDIGEMHRES